MKLFKFYPHSFSRMYVLAESKEALLEKGDYLFDQFLRKHFYFAEDYKDHLDDDEISMYRKGFDISLNQAEVGTEFVDNHY